MEISSCRGGITTTWGLERSRRTGIPASFWGVPGNTFRDGHPSGGGLSTASDGFQRHLEASADKILGGLEMVFYERLEDATGNEHSPTIDIRLPNDIHHETPLSSHGYLF